MKDKMLVAKEVACKALSYVFLVTALFFLVLTDRTVSRVTAIELSEISDTLFNIQFFIIAVVFRYFSKT